MITFFSSISFVLFIITFGLHMEISEDLSSAKPIYLKKPILLTFIWLSGFVLPVICLSYILEYKWYYLFFANFLFVFGIGPLLTGLFISIFNKKELGVKLLISFTIGFISFCISTFLK
jgi:hypothetical protein